MVPTKTTRTNVRDDDGDSIVPVTGRRPAGNFLALFPQVCPAVAPRLMKLLRVGGDVWRRGRACVQSLCSVSGDATPPATACASVRSGSGQRCPSRDGQPLSMTLTLPLHPLTGCQDEHCLQ